MGIQMLVYSEVTLSVTRWHSNGTTPVSLIIFRKCVESFTYDLLCVEGGLRKGSTKLEMFSVGHPLADTIGLPVEAVIPLCIWGGKVYVWCFAFSVL